MKYRSLRIRLISCFVMLAALSAFLCVPASAQKRTSIERSSPEITNPIADPRAVVGFGHARFTVLTPQLIRMEWAADEHFEDHASLVFLNRRLPVPSFSVHNIPSGIVIETSGLKLTFHPHNLSEKFAPEDLTVELLLNGQPVTWHPGLSPKGNLLGTTRTLDNPDRIATIPPKLETGLLSRDGWTLVDDSTRPLFDSSDFSFRSGEVSPWPWVIERPSGERQDWYFFGYGHDYKAEMADFVQVAGRIPLPPRFAFGTWWSRYWAYTDQELDHLVQEFHDNNVPLDILVIDMEWHNTLGMHYDQRDPSGNKLGWTGYTWNHALFPHPEEFLQNLHREGLKVTLNLHPAAGVQMWEERYPQMAHAMGVDPTLKQYIPFDITDKTFARNYFDILHHPLEHQGIDFWWLDWQQGETTKIAGLNPTWWLNYTHFTDQQRQGKRPLLFHRWGGLGNHRYQIGFSGDTISDWAGLDLQPAFTATAANVAYAYWSHDIGGHIPGKVDPELYTRWVQFGVFSPILRTHTTKSPDAERRIWAYPEPYSRLMRDAFHLRYALQPYIYTEARRTYDTGVALMHPLYYEWPESDAAYTHKNEYMFGNSMLVAPITSPIDSSSDLADEEIWIPPGEWIEWQTGRHRIGPAIVEEKVSLSQTPVYVRTGAIVPMQPDMMYTGERKVDPLKLFTFPTHSSQASSYTLYEDNSTDETYKDGICSWTKIDAQYTGDTLTLKVLPVKGRYTGMPSQRAYEIYIPGQLPPDSVIIDGRQASYDSTQRVKPSWSYTGNHLTTMIAIPSTSTSHTVTVVVIFPHAAKEVDAARNGFAGRIERLRTAYDAVNTLAPEVYAPEPLVEALQTGDRISYAPRTAQSELEQFTSKYDLALRSVRDLLSVERMAHTPETSHNTPEQIIHTIVTLQKAVAQLED